MLITRQNIGAKRNKLLQYKLIMEEFNKHDCRYMPITVIHKEFIYPKFHISRDTLYKIFKISIDEELEKISLLLPTD